MKVSDEIFSPADRKKSAPGGSSNPRWILILHVTWVILLGVGIWYGYTSWQFVSHGQVVSATVVALEEISDSDGISYSPVFEYQIDGRIYTYESVNSSNPPTHDVGEQTELWVMPDNPERAREDSFWELWLLPVVMGLSAGLVAVIAIIASVAGRLSKP